MPIAGREALAEQALTQWAAGQDVLLTGPAGIGRSTLLADLERQVGQGLVLRASPAPADARMPLVTLIDLCAGIPVAYFAALAPPTRQLLERALRRHDRTADKPDTLGVCLGLLDLIRDAGAKQPVTLVLDDLQWMDPASGEVLWFVRRRVEPGRLRLLATACSDVDTGDLWPSAHRLPLPPLPAEVLVPRLLAEGGVCVTLPVAHRIHVLTAGNPRQALDIAEAVRRSGVIPDPGTPLPVTVHADQLVRRGVSTLPPSARETVGLAATAYRPDLRLLERETLLADLAAAAQAGLCDVTADGTVEFGHPMLREAVYAQAPAIVRMGWHAWLAEAVTDPVEQAWHLALAGGAPIGGRTVAALGRAAELEAGRGAWDRAWELSRLAALRGATATAEARYACQALRAAAQREARSGNPAQAKDLIRRAIAGASVADTAPTELASLHHLLGTLCLHEGELADAVQALDRAHRLDRTKVTLVADLAEALVPSDPGRAESLLAQAPAQHPAVLRAHAVLTFEQGRPAEAADLLEVAVRGLSDPDDVPEQVRVLLLSARIQRRRRRRAAARALLGTAAQLCEQTGATVWARRVEAELDRLLPPATGRAGLTPMQERIAGLAVKGATNVEIARNLSIAVTTVEGALTQIYRRFDIRSRVELTRKFG